MGTAYGLSLAALSHAWYKDQGRSEFHTFNDCNQWNKVDKIGHAYSAYHISRVGKELFLWTNMDKKKAAIWGTVLSQVTMLPIEILDGFSEEFGFSWCDIAANAIGGGLFLTQELLLDRQIFKPKFSFHRTPYAKIRPEVLGDGILQEFLKDYNGQTYWLSIDLYGLMKPQSKFPKWLNVTLGYGADQMVYGSEDENNLNGYQSYKQLFFSVDFDLSYIRTNKKAVEVLLFIADMIKLPAPTLEYNKNEGLIFHPLYF